MIDLSDLDNPRYAITSSTNGCSSRCRITFYRRLVTLLRLLRMEFRRNLEIRMQHL